MLSFVGTSFEQTDSRTIQDSRAIFAMEGDFLCLLRKYISASFPRMGPSNKLRATPRGVPPGFGDLGALRAWSLLGRLAEFTIRRCVVRILNRDWPPVLVGSWLPGSPGISDNRAQIIPETQVQRGVQITTPVSSPLEPLCHSRRESKSPGADTGPPLHLGFGVLRVRRISESEVQPGQQRGVFLR